MSEGARRPRRLFPGAEIGPLCVLALSVFRQRARPLVEVGAPIWDLRFGVQRDRVICPVCTAPGGGQKQSPAPSWLRAALALF